MNAHQDYDQGRLDPGDAVRLVRDGDSLVKVIPRIEDYRTVPLPGSVPDDVRAPIRHSMGQGERP